MRPPSRTMSRAQAVALPAALTVLGALTGAVLAVGPASAAAVSVHVPISFPAAGATLRCGSTTIQTTGGLLVGQFHETQDVAGMFHYEGTNVARDVTGADATGASYRIVGTSSFSGTSTDPDGVDNVRWHNTVEFVVLGPHGDRIGKVDVVERLNASGSVVLELGDCTGLGGGDDDNSL